MERRSEARTELGPWVERLAWNAAALAALAVGRAMGSEDFAARPRGSD